MKLDAYDVVLGMGGLALFGYGVGTLFGWPWVALIYGAAAVAIYVLHELGLVGRD